MHADAVGLNSFKVAAGGKPASLHACMHTVAPHGPHLPVCPCCDQLALVWVVHYAQEERVGKHALPPPASIQVPNDAAAVAAGAHTLIICAGLDHNTVDWALVVFHAGLHGLGLLAQPPYTHHAWVAAAASVN